jgi:transposase
VAEPVRVRRLTDQEGQKLLQIVRRRSTNSVRYRWAMMLLASAGGNRVPVIAQLVQADEDTVRDVIHRCNEIGLACLDPQWAGGRPRLLNPDDEDFVIRTATTRPTKLGQPFTRWSLRKLVACLRKAHGRGHPDRPRGPTLPARPPRCHLPAHQDVEGIPRPRARGEAGPDRGPGPLPGPGLRL